MIEISIHDDVHQLRMRSWRTRFAGYEVSAFLVRGLLVDTGFAGAAGALRRWIQEARGSAAAAGRSAAPEPALRSAVVTHAHEDHSGTAGMLQQLGIPVWIAPASRHALAHQGAIPLYRRFTWGSPLPLAPSASAPAAVPFPAGIEVVPAPGHSDDHHVVWDDETGTLFGGDLFLGVKVRVAHHSEKPRLLAATLRRCAALEPARLFDAHRGSVPMPAAALRAKADWLEETIAAIEHRAARGMSARRITAEVLGREPSEYYVSAAEYSKLSLVMAVLGGN